jgi:hypothetical protein
MDFHRKVKPLDFGVTKVVLLSLAVIVIAVGASIFSLTYLLAGRDVAPALYGAIVVWIGSLGFFYAVITEEHTMKEIFLRQSYFFTGVLGMILGMFFVSLGGFGIGETGSAATAKGSMELGVLLLIVGAALTLLSAQRTGDYSRRSALFGMAAGIMLAVGGLMAGTVNVAYGGVFIVIISAVWMGLRTSHAQ